MQGTDEPPDYHFTRLARNIPQLDHNKVIEMRIAANTVASFHCAPTVEDGVAGHQH